MNIDLENRVLPFDTSAATVAASIVAKLNAMGRPIELRDALIAGTVAAQPAGVLATRNTRHFIDTDIDLINPWTMA